MLFSAVPAKFHPFRSSRLRFLLYQKAAADGNERSARRTSCLAGAAGTETLKGCQKEIITLDPFQFDHTIFLLRAATGDKDQEADSGDGVADGRSIHQPARRLGVHLQRDLRGDRQQSQTAGHLWLLPLRLHVRKGAQSRRGRTSFHVFPTLCQVSDQNTLGEEGHKLPDAQSLGANLSLA